jgi:hypothetical protein
MSTIGVTGAQARSPSSLVYAAFGLLNVTIGGIACLALPLVAGDARPARVASALFILGIAVGAPTVAALRQRLPATALPDAGCPAAGALLLVRVAPALACQPRHDSPQRQHDCLSGL